MKKILAILLSMVMVLSLFAGCVEEEESRSSKKKDKNKNENSQVGDFFGDDVVTPPVVTAPEAIEPTVAPTEPVKQVRLTVGLPMTNTVMDHDSNALTTWVENMTGSDVQFTLYAGGADVSTQIATTIAAQQELPDVLLNVNLPADTINRYGQDGYLLDLTPYFEDRNGASKVFWQRLEENCGKDEIDFIYNTVMKDAQTGGIYGVPTVVLDLMENTYKLNNFITADCENPDEAFEMMMLLWSEEGYFRVRYGEENTNWVKAEKGMITADGTPAKIKVIHDPANEKNTCLWHHEVFCTLSTPVEQAQ